MVKNRARAPRSLAQQCVCGPRSLAWGACLALAIGVFRGQATAEDTIYVSSSANPQARAKITGRITDFNGRELVVVTGGVEKRYPAAQIAEVETDWTPRSWRPTSCLPDAITGPRWPSTKKPCAR